ncbi:MAG: MBL fold metallo-hydrolase [Dysgonomonas sp.]
MFEIHIIETGYIMADGGAMFGALPKRAWQRKYACDNDNLCPLAMRCILAVSHKRKILVDLGLGNPNTKQAAYYAPHEIKDIESELGKLGYSNAEITDVVLTHLHFDHCGYATNSDDDSPSFPNARYWVSRKQWINLLDPNLLEKDSLSQDCILPIYDAGLLNMVDEDIFLDDGFEVRLFDGHSDGQLIPFIQTKEGITVFASDVVPTASHASLEWISAYDINALASAKEKRRLLEEAVANDYTLIYYHDAVHAMSKVKRINDNFKASV